MLTDEKIKEVKWRNGQESLRLSQFIESNKVIKKCFVGTDSQPGGLTTRFSIAVCIKNDDHGVNFVVWSFKEKNNYMELFEYFA